MHQKRDKMVNKSISQKTFNNIHFFIRFIAVSWKKNFRKKNFKDVLTGLLSYQHGNFGNETSWIVNLQNRLNWQINHKIYMILLSLFGISNFYLLAIRKLGCACNFLSNSGETNYLRKRPILNWNQLFCYSFLTRKKQAPKEFC